MQEFESNKADVVLTRYIEKVKATPEAYYIIVVGDGLVATLEDIMGGGIVNLKSYGSSLESMKNRVCFTETTKEVFDDTNSNPLLAEKDIVSITIPEVEKVNPLDIVTSMFKPEEILFDHDDFVVATGQEMSKGKEVGGRLAMRWTNGKIGYPNGFGNPQWFLLSTDMTAIVMTDVRHKTCINLTLKKDRYDDIALGTILNCDGNYCTVVDKSIHGIPEVSFSGTPNERTKSVSDFDHVEVSPLDDYDEPYLITPWHGTDTCIWLQGNLIVTRPIEETNRVFDWIVYDDDLEVVKTERFSDMPSSLGYLVARLEKGHTEEELNAALKKATTLRSRPFKSDEVASRNCLTDPQVAAWLKARSSRSRRGSSTYIVFIKDIQRDIVGARDLAAQMEEKLNIVAAMDRATLSKVATGTKLSSMYRSLADIKATYVEDALADNTAGGEEVETYLLAGLLFEVAEGDGPSGKGIDHYLSLIHI